MIEFYEYDGAEYNHIGTIEDGEVTKGDLEWVLDFVETTDGLETTDEEAVVYRVSNDHLVGVIPDGDDDRELSEGMPEWERAFMGMYEHALWHDDTDRALAGFSESALPEMVTERMREAILGGSLFSEFDTVPSDRLADLRSVFAEKLTEGDGWTLEELTGAIQDVDDSLEEFEAERIARTETQHTVQMARKDAYEDRGLADANFKWTGPNDHRNAEFDGVEICRRIAQETDPSLGGEPRTLEELDELIQNVHDELGIGTSYREFTPHINCRFTYTRVVE